MTEYVLVPVEPSEEMEAAVKVYQDRETGFYFESPSLMYTAMLAARPRQEWVKSSERLPAIGETDYWQDVWVCDRSVPGVFSDHYSAAGQWDYWMPKPRVATPEPPEWE